MFPLQPSVVMGGHIGNQSWNRRRVQRAGPPALDRLLFGPELPLYGRKEWREVNLYTAHTHTHTHGLLYIHVSMHMGEPCAYGSRNTSQHISQTQVTWGNSHICTVHNKLSERRARICTVRCRQAEESNSSEDTER